MSKKKLDNIFQETFKDFHPEPNERVWQRIENTLNQKKKKRIIPIWWQFGGVAALLIISVLIFNPFKNMGLENQYPQVNTPSKDNITPKEIEKFDVETSVVATPTTQKTTQGVSAAKTNSGKRVTSTSSENAANTPISYATKEKDQLINSPKSIKPVQADYNVLAQNEGDKNKQEDIVSDKTSNQKYLGLEEINENETTIIAAQNEENEDLKSLFDEISEKEEIKENEPKNAKWAVGPSVAPVYFNGLSGNSPIDASFNANPKSGNLNLSYGVQVAYEINEKWSVRSGIHKVGYGYDTEGVTFSSSLGNRSNDIENIDYARSSRNIIVQSKVNPSPQEFGFSALAEFTLDVPSLDGKMSQQLGYLEVPLEVNYNILDKKFGLNIIGGFSSLYLIENSVTLHSQELVAEMGEANNISPLNFSTNIGLGLNYHLSSKTQFNIEPMFKYQLNTFQSETQGFQPYSIGVYSGLRIKF